MPRRLRLLIYETDTEEHMEQQRIRDFAKTTMTIGEGHKRVTITSIELDPRRITALELLRLLHREQPGKTTG